MSIPSATCCRSLASQRCARTTLRRALKSGGLLAAVIVIVASTPAAQDVRQPAIRFTPDDAFDAAVTSGYAPAQTSADTPIVHAAISVFNKHGVTPSVAPRLAGSAPYYIFTDRLKLPMVMGALGHGGGAHAPNEYMVVEPTPGSRIAGLARVERFYVDFLYAFSEMKK